MIVRKNVSLDESYLNKIKPLLNAHEGNLSAAIRDAIDLTYTAVKEYGSFEAAQEALNSPQKRLSPIEESVQQGESVVLNRPFFLWLLKSARGLLIDLEIVEELLEPGQLKTISDLDRRMNTLSREWGWDIEVSIYTMDNLNPQTATLSVSGSSELIREFAAQCVSLFLHHYKGLLIENLHRRASSIRVDYSKKGRTVKECFGSLQDRAVELQHREDFWTNLIKIYQTLNYDLVVLQREHYENLLLGRTPRDTRLFESLTGNHLDQIPHQTFLETLKKVQETMQIADKIEILPDGINIYHNYKDETAISKLKNYYLELLAENGHTYDAKCSSSLIILKHTCCPTE